MHFYCSRASSTFTRPHMYVWESIGFCQNACKHFRTKLGEDERYLGKVKLYQLGNPALKEKVRLVQAWNTS
jgi:hypothetical protein